MAAKHEIDFDFDALEAELYKDIANSITCLQLDYPDDPFYAYTLYVPEYMGYVSILAYTESRLDAVAKEFLHSQTPADSDVNIERTTGDIHVPVTIIISYWMRQVTCWASYSENATRYGITTNSN